MKYEKEIRAALDGKPIELRRQLTDGWWGGWLPTSGDIRRHVVNMAAEYNTIEYRIAPAPDIVRYGGVSLTNPEHWGWSDISEANAVWKHNQSYAILQVTFDAETKQVKDVQLVKENE